MKNTLMEFREKFMLDELKIFETEYWIWSPRPHQATLGAGVLSLKRSSENFSNLTVAEFNDLGIAIKKIEATLKHAFNYTEINYLMLMMVDKQMHFHVLPRYKTELLKFNKEWKDTNWPSIPELTGEVEGKVTLEDIKRYITDI